MYFSISQKLIGKNYVSKKDKGSQMLPDHLLPVGLRKVRSHCLPGREELQSRQRVDQQALQHLLDRGRANWPELGSGPGDRVVHQRKL